MTSPGQHNQTTSGRWTTLPAAWSAPAGPRGSDTLAKVRAATAALLIIAAGWLAWALLAPLPSVESDPLSPLAPVPSIQTRRDSIEFRRDHLASLTSTNVFDAQRKLWATSSPSPAATTTPAESPPPATAQRIPADSSLPSTELIDSLPPDLKAAYANLSLRALRRDSDGQMAAMISFNTGSAAGGPAASTTPTAAGTPAPVTPSALRSRSVRVGEKFTDTAFPSEDWTLLAVDTEQRRAIVTRGGKNIDLWLFGTNAPRPKLPRIDQVGNKKIERQTREEIEAQLRDLNLPPDQIAELLRKADQLKTTAAAPAPGLTPAPPTNTTTPPTQPVQTVATPKAAEPTPAEGTMSVTDLFKVLMSGKPPVEGGGSTNPATPPADAGKAGGQTPPPPQKP